MHVASRFAVCVLAGAGLLLSLRSVELRGQTEAAPQPTQQPSAPAPHPQPPRSVIVLDPGHGGTDPGADLGNKAAEKDVTLALATKLRSALAAQGFAVLVTRDSDAVATADQRAQTANRSRALACISLHATHSGSGVHVYTSALQPAPDDATYLPARWQTAQDRFVAQSTRLAATLKSAFDSARLGSDVRTATVPPLDSLTCPAVAIEFAPIDNLAAAGKDPVDAAYQDSAVKAVTAALARWRTDNAAQPATTAAPDTKGAAQ